MQNISLVIPEDLDKRIITSYGKHYHINKSEFIRDAIEDKLKILESIKDIRKISLSNIRADIIVELYNKIKIMSLHASFEFGKDLFLSWINDNDNSKYLFLIAEISESDHMLEDVYEKVGEYLSPIAEYERLFGEEHETVFDINAFSDGFISTAKYISGRFGSIILSK